MRRRFPCAVRHCARATACAGRTAFIAAGALAHAFGAPGGVQSRSAKELFRQDDFSPKALEQVAQSINDLQLGVVDYRVLQNRRGHIDVSPIS